MKKLHGLLSVAGIAVSLLYLLNPGAGLFELIPDALPVVGNLDEAGATALLLACVRVLREMRQRPELPASADT